MNENKYAFAGWLAVAGAILILPVLPSAFIVDSLQAKGALASPFAGLFMLLSVTQSALVIYAFYRFKGFLNEQHNFHRTDLLMTAIIVLTIVLATIAVIARLSLWAGSSGTMGMGYVTLLILLGIPLGVLSVIFGIKLLELDDSGLGLMKPYAYLNIVAGALIVTFILAPIGVLLASVGDLLMGLMMLRKGPVAEPEFV